MYYEQSLIQVLGSYFFSGAIKALFTYIGPMAFSEKAI